MPIPTQEEIISFSKTISNVLKMDKVAASIGRKNTNEFWEWACKQATSKFNFSIQKDDFPQQVRANLTMQHALIYQNMTRPRAIIRGYKDSGRHRKNYLQQYRGNQKDYEWRCKCKESHSSLEQHKAAMAKIKFKW